LRASSKAFTRSAFSRKPCVEIPCSFSNANFNSLTLISELLRLFLVLFLLLTTYPALSFILGFDFDRAGSGDDVFCGSDCADVAAGRRARAFCRASIISPFSIKFPTTPYDSNSRFISPTFMLQMSGRGHIAIVGSQGRLLSIVWRGEISRRQTWRQCPRKVISLSNGFSR